MYRNALTNTIERALGYPGNPTSAVLIYVHNGESTQHHLEVSSKEDAEKMLVEVESVADSLRSFIEKGRA